MDEIRQYILSIIVTALICGILSAIVPNGRSKVWIQFLCGLILTISFIKPVSGLKEIDLSSFEKNLYQDGNQIAADGKIMAQEAMANIISQNCQTYIMDKAAELGIQIEAEISVSNDAIPVPVSALLYGTPAPYARLQLEALIENDLGIVKENIRWMQQNTKEP